MTSKDKLNAAAGGREMRYAVLPDRMPAIAPEKMTAEQQQAVREISGGARGEVRGPYWAILRSPGLMNPMQKIGEYLRFHCRLDKRIGRMAVLMCARAWTQGYLWNAHYPVAIKAGLKPDIIDAIAEGRRPVAMAADEEVLYDFLTELEVHKSISDPTYARCVAMYGESGVIDILGVVGYFSMLAIVLNVTRTPLHDQRPLPLAPLPEQMRSLTPGAMTPSSYTLTPSQLLEFGE